MRTCTLLFTLRRNREDACNVAQSNCNRSSDLVSALPYRPVISCSGRIYVSAQELASALILIVVRRRASAQVLTPAEIKDPDLRSLQQQYINDLKVVGQDIQALPLKYHFYLNRKLDLDESQQQTCRSEVDSI